MRLQAPRGTQDLLPGRTHLWQTLERTYFDLAVRYGYGEIRTPMFEETALFKRTSGEGSDIVQKEMYTFTDRGDRDLALKPEGTAPVMRALIEAGRLAPGLIGRYAYRTEIFRYGRPGRGRLRQAHQFGAELVGSSAATADAEMIEMTMAACAAFGIEGAVAKLNSIGRGECRSRYGAAVLAHVASYLQGLDSDGRARIEANPLGLLDAKDPLAREALVDVPSIRDYLEPEALERLVRVEAMLTEADVPFEPDAGIVRGLDYYTETVFEVVAPSLPDLSIAGGGRYDDLVAQLGGAATPAVGFGMGIERAILCLEAQETLPVEKGPRAFVVAATPDAADAVRGFVRDLRRSRVSALSDLDLRSIKSQLRQADVAHARFAALIGTDELAAGTVTIRDLEASTQETLPREDALARLIG